VVQSVVTSGLLPLTIYRHSRLTTLAGCARCDIAAQGVGLCLCGLRFAARLVIPVCTDACWFTHLVIPIWLAYGNHLIMRSLQTAHVGKARKLPHMTVTLPSQHSYAVGIATQLMEVW
jgi:hypothetical protein